MPMSAMALRKRWFTLRLALRRSLAVRCICSQEEHAGSAVRVTL
jgi:hypothetical protein